MIGIFWSRVFAAFLTVSAGVVSAPSEVQAQSPDRLVETYATWTVRCTSAETEDGETQLCNMQQQLGQRTSNGQQRVLLTVLIGKGEDADTANLTVVAPFGVRVMDGMKIAVGDETVEMDFLTCRRQGCIVRHTLEADAIAAMRADDAAEFSMNLVGGEEAKLSISLDGFSAALARIQEL